MRLVTCSAWVTKPKQGNLGPKAGKKKNLLTFSALLSKGLSAQTETEREKLHTHRKRNLSENKRFFCSPQLW